MYYNIEVLCHAVTQHLLNPIGVEVHLSKHIRFVLQQSAVILTKAYNSSQGPASC